MGIWRKTRNQFRYTTEEKEGRDGKATAENILKRNFYAKKPNEKWATDVSEFKIPNNNKKL